MEENEKALVVCLCLEGACCNLCLETNQLHAHNSELGEPDLERLHPHPRP